MKSMQDRVSYLLDTAMENGHDFRIKEPLLVARDLCTYSADMERQNAKDLIPFVKVWQASKEI